MIGFAHRPVRTLAAAVVAAFGFTAAAPAALVEDFDTGWANDGSNLGGPAAQHNGWTIFNPVRYQILTATGRGNVVGTGTATGTLSERTAGKAHGLALDGAAAVTVDLSFRANLGKAESAVQVWLADATQNGYGLVVTRNADDAQNSVAVVKFRGSDSPFGAKRLASESASDAVIAGGAAFDEYRLRIEQAQPGGEVTFTVWSDAVAGSSYEQPVLRVVDGAGGPFQGDRFSLAALTHAAWSADRATASGGTAQLDDLRFEALIPEPATLGLIGCGGLLALTRHRAP